MKFNQTNLIIEREKVNGNIYDRIVYFDQLNNRYIKKWNSDFFYKHYFTNAYKAGFYQDIALIEDVIDEDGDILGYITTAGKPICYANLDKNKYRDLIDRVVNNCNIYNIVYIDMVVNNVIEYNDKYYLVDLEASIPVNDLHLIQDITSILQFNNYSYIKKIANLLTSVSNNNTSIIKTVSQQTDWDKEIKYGTANGRIFLEKEYLPQLTGKTLFIGVNYYNDFYHLLLKEPHCDYFETLDVEETQIEFGNPNKHYICNILDFKSDYLYNNVIFFGIIGHKDDWDIIKSEQEVIKCINVLDTLVAPGGNLLLGPACIYFKKEFWDVIYNLPVLKKYTNISLKKIDINYIWQGKKNG